MADKLKRYTELQNELNKLREELETLEDSPEIRRDLEFKNQLETMLQQYGYAVSDVFRVLMPDDPANAPKASKTRAQRAVQVYENPHTGEVIETRGGNHKTLKKWREEYGRDAVKSWRKQ